MKSSTPSRNRFAPRLMALETRVVPTAEFQVNTYTTGSQIGPAVAADDDGNFVVVWASANQDGWGYGVYAQRFNAAGAPLGGEFRVNTFTVFSQGDAAVAMDADGDFVVAWEAGLQDGSETAVYAQRFSASGVPQGAEFRVNTYTNGFQYQPAVAMADDGQFVVAWASWAGQDGNDHGVFAQRYSATGIPVGGEFQVNVVWTGIQYHPSIAMDAVGNFVIAWETGNPSTGINARRYDANGTPQGNDFQVSAAWGAEASIASDPAGNFVIAWEGSDDGSVRGVKARLYTAAGVPQGAEFHVNTYTTNSQQYSSVAMDAAGSFTVVWQGGGGQDGDYLGVFGQRYGPTGIAEGGEFQVNTYTTAQQHRPVVAANAAGDFVVSWSSWLQDGNETGVFARIFADPPAVDSVQVNEGAAQRSRVTSLAVTFSTAVTFNGPVASAFQLTRQGGGNVVNFDASAQTIGGQTIVTLNNFTGAETQFGSLADGNYSLTVIANQISDAFGEALDGNGDGTPGDNYMSSFHRLFGDANGDRTVNAFDFAVFRTAFGIGPSIFDFDNDGQTNANDFVAFRIRFGLTILP